MSVPRACRPAAIVMACLAFAGAGGAISAALPETASFGGPGTVILYHLTGVIDVGDVATTVHCTNLEAVAAVDLRLVVLDQAGAVSCNTTPADLAAGRTWTMSTTATAVFFEDANCGPTGGSVSGSARIVAESSGALDILCTAQLVDGTQNPPRFLEKLELYDGQARPVGSQGIFRDGFESSTTLRWSVQFPP